LIIDAHTHIFPDKIAVKASENIGGFYGIPMLHDGTADVLLESGKSAGVGKFLIHSVAVTPEQVSGINTFISEAAARHPEFIGFAAMHPDMKNAEAELGRAEKLRLCGVKLHPDFQRFEIDGKKAENLIKHIEGRFPLLIHAGDKRYGFSNPKRIAAMLDKFPKLDVICAHFGGYTEWDDALEYLAGRRLWVDTSSSLPFISPEKARNLINAFGEDRVFFGTDYPMWDAADELALIEKLNLPQAVQEKIFYKNICSLMNIPCKGA